jgi:two-component system, OmpR family, sensor histidine kinase TctE
MDIRRSLRAQLLGWLIVPLLLMLVVNAYSAYWNARRTAGVITDRLLLAAARVLAEQVHEENGRIEAVIPPSALEIFVSVGRDRALYQISGPDGALIAGYPDVEPPPSAVAPDEPVFFSSHFRTSEVRAVALAQPLTSFGDKGAALVIVGATLREEDRVVGELWREGATQQAILVLLAGALALFGLNRGLAPLIALRDHVRERDPEALTPFAPSAVQSELAPLVDALNDALARIKGQIAIRRRFIADAAHQLRTPLTLLKTQAGVGLRAGSLQAKDEALAAIDSGADNMTRMANQLLALARNEPGGAPPVREDVDLAALARKVLDARAARAVDRDIDLGFEDGQARIVGDPTMLAELIANLIDNSLAYGNSPGRITVATSTQGASVVLRVEDDGPGIAPAERAQVFKRFYRVLGTGVEGSGLGLSIVREIAAAHGATVELSEPKAGSGLVVEVKFPTGQIGK